MDAMRPSGSIESIRLPPIIASMSNGAASARNLLKTRAKRKVISMSSDATDGAYRSRAGLAGHRQLHVTLEVLRRYASGFCRCYLAAGLPSVAT